MDMTFRHLSTTWQHYLYHNMESSLERKWITLQAIASLKELQADFILEKKKLEGKKAKGEEGATRIIHWHPVISNKRWT